MPDSIIIAEQVSKKFTISHEADARYRTIRESLSGYGNQLPESIKRPHPKHFGH